jgi:cytochrome c-type biogenesis protein CcmH/NrfG
MPRTAVASSARNGFVLGVCTGLVAASTYFLVRAEIAAPEQTGGLVTTGMMPPASRAPATGTPGATAGSMEAATLALKTRLAAQGGPDEQWELLAQSYEFLGRTAEAKLAREHKASSSGTLSDAVAASVALLPGTQMARVAVPTSRTEASEVASLLASAEQYRRKREFKQACAAYAAVARTSSMTADAWADYADAQASLAGRLAGAPEKAIESALSLDPKHPKALWLKASLAHEERHYREALATWQRLLAVVPPGSSDARIVEANIAEAMRLASG